MSLGRNTRLTQDEFLAAAVAMHGDRYDYSEAVYISQKLKVKIRCHQHGSFVQNAASHIHGGRGCPECALHSEKRKGHIRPARTQESIEAYRQRFLCVASTKHGDVYDYSLADFSRGCRSTLLIRCRRHECNFQQPAGSHLSGKTSCKKCAFERKSRARTKTTAWFVEKSAGIHGCKYDYSKAEYRGSHCKTTIICPIHGEWQQIPTNHLAGYGCPECAIHKTFHEKHIPLAERDDPAIVYVLKIEVGRQRFAKLGYSARFSDRASRYKNQGVKILEKRLFKSTKFLAFQVERQTHLAMKENRADPKKRFGGMRECYPLEMFNQLAMEVETRIADGKVRAS